MPSTPLKSTERRADRWHEAMGVAQTEIDALAALQPALLRRMAARPSRRSLIRPSPAGATPLNPSGAMPARRQSTNRPIRSISTRIAEQANEALETVREQIKALEEQIRIDPGDYELPGRPDLPEPEIAAEPDGSPLMNSAWSWAEQSPPADRLEGLRWSRRMSALARPNALTFVTACASLAKRVTVIDGVVTRTDDPPWPRIVTFVTVEVDTPDDLLEVLSSAADQTRRRASCAPTRSPTWAGARSTTTPRRGRPACASCRGPGSATTSRRCRPTASTRLQEPERAVAKARRCLPPPHHDATVVWQITASAGKRRDELRLRLWFLLDRPMLGRQVEAWCKPGHRFRLARPVHAPQRGHPALHRRQDRRQQPGPLPAALGPDPRRARPVPVPDSALVLPASHRDGVTWRSPATSTPWRSATARTSIAAAAPPSKRSRRRSRPFVPPVPAPGIRPICAPRRRSRACASSGASRSTGRASCSRTPTSPPLRPTKPASASAAPPGRLVLARPAGSA